MKLIAVVILIIYQLGLMIIGSKTKEENLKNIMDLIYGLIPIAMCIILVM